jgi:4-amino-4-deoxy-L-arabinose transferase-like glycosyltransferase
MPRYPDRSNVRGVQPTGPSSRQGAGTLGAGRRRPFRTDAAAILLIVAVGLALRLAFAARMPVLIDGDSSQYHEAAYALLTGQGFPLPLARQPLYPAFIALVALLLGESLERLALVQHLLGLGTAVLTYLVGRLTFGRLAGLAAGLAVACSGGQLIYERHVMSEVLSTFLLLVAVSLLLLGLRRDQARYYLAGGLAVGLASLSRPQSQALLVLLPIVAAAMYQRRGPVLRAAGYTTATALLVLTPWMARNALVHGTFTISAGTGHQLVDRVVFHRGFVFSDPESARDAAPALALVQRTVQDIARKHATDDLLERQLASIYKTQVWLSGELGLSLIETDGLMRETALEGIRSNPALYLRIVAFDAWRNLTGTIERPSEHLRGRPPAEARLSALLPQEAGPSRRSAAIAEADALANLYQAPRLGPLLLGLFLIGTLGALVVPTWRIALLPALAVLTFQVASAALAPHLARYAYPAAPLLHVVAAGGLLYLARLLVRRRAPAAPPHQEREIVTAAAPAVSAAVQD